MRHLLPPSILLLLFAAAPAAAQQPLHPPDENIRQLIDQAGGPQRHPGANYVVVIDRSETDVEDSGLAHVRRRTVSKVLTGGGALALARARADYDPATNAIDFQRIAVHRAGGPAEEVDLHRQIDTAAPATGIYWGARMKVVPLPRLNPGDAVEIETYKQGFQIAYLGGGTGGGTAGPDNGGLALDDARFIPPMRGHFYDVVLFQDAVPVMERTATVRVPRGKPLQFSVYNGDVRSSLTLADAALIYTFWKTDVPPFVPEPRTPQASDVVPKVVMATIEDWPARSRWFFDTNEWVFASNPAIDAKVADITRGLTSDDEKMEALLHWVAQEIRYAGFSMGKGEGYTIHPGAMTFEERCGVCKDLAGMLVTMLRSAGFTSYAAMTMAGPRVEAVPADQFNHCVAAVKKPDGSFVMLDPTWAPFNRGIWSRAEGEQQYVIGSPEGEQLRTTRSFAPEESLLRVVLRARILGDGTVRGTLLLTGDGQSDSFLRKETAFTGRGRLRYALEKKVGLMAPDGRLLSFNTGDPRDFSRPMFQELEFELPAYALQTSGALLWQPCALRVLMDQPALFRMAQVEPTDERTFPMMNWFTQKVVLEETYELPRGFSLTGSGREWTAGQGAASVELAVSGGKRRAQFGGAIWLNQRTVPPGGWPAVRETAQALQQAAGAWLSASRAAGEDR